MIRVNKGDTRSLDNSSHRAELGNSAARSMTGTRASAALSMTGTRAYPARVDRNARRLLNPSSL